MNTCNLQCSPAGEAQGFLWSKVKTGMLVNLPALAWESAIKMKFQSCWQIYLLTFIWSEKTLNQLNKRSHCYFTAYSSALQNDTFVLLCSFRCSRKTIVLALKIAQSIHLCKGEGKARFNIKWSLIKQTAFKSTCTLWKRCTYSCSLSRQSTISNA